MNIFDELENLYDEIDMGYARIEGDARVKGYHKKESKFSKKRELNDHAYFLFMFTRLEGRIRNISDKLIDDKVGQHRDWKKGRSWEIIKKLKSNDSLRFMDRIALLTKKGETHYNLINNYYTQRNDIAHGGTPTYTISIPDVISDLKMLFRTLK